MKQLIQITENNLLGAFYFNILEQLKFKVTVKKT